MGRHRPRSCSLVLYLKLYVGTASTRLGVMETGIMGSTLFSMGSNSAPSGYGTNIFMCHTQNYALWYHTTVRQAQPDRPLLAAGPASQRNTCNNVECGGVIVSNSSSVLKSEAVKVVEQNGGFMLSMEIGIPRQMCLSLVHSKWVVLMLQMMIKSCLQLYCGPQRVLLQNMWCRGLLWTKLILGMLHSGYVVHCSVRRSIIYRDLEQFSRVGNKTHVRNAGGGAHVSTRNMAKIGTSCDHRKPITNISRPCASTMSCVVCVAEVQKQEQWWFGILFLCGFDVPRKLP